MSKAKIADPKPSCTFRFQPDLVFISPNHDGGARSCPSLSVPSRGREPECEGSAQLNVLASLDYVFVRMDNRINSFWQCPFGFSNWNSLDLNRP